MTSNMEFILEQSVKALVRVTGVGYEARKIVERAYRQGWICTTRWGIITGKKKR